MLHVELPDPPDDGGASLGVYLRKAGLQFSSDRENLLSEYVNLLLHWNRTHNLISRSDTGNVWSKHVTHSLVPLLMFSFPNGLRGIDIGTGGGFPGVPIAIARQDIFITLVDSIGKKCDALRQIVREIGLANVEVIHGRVESAPVVRTCRGRFDFALARGVAPLKELIRWAVPLMSSAGRRPLPLSRSLPGETTPNLPSLLCFKGGDLTNEKAAAGRSGTIREYGIRFGGGSRFLEGKKIITVDL